jgi:hypothetical protein
MTAIPSSASGAHPDDHPVFSSRLSLFLDQVNDGAAPNSGSFCAECYTPLPQGFEACDHCGLAVEERAPLTSLPLAVLDMHRRKLKRESMVVNSFAYLGLALGLAVFLGMVAINVLLLDRALWFFVLATIVFLLGSRLLAALLGGVIGDEIGYRYANRRLAEDWERHVAERATRASSLSD